MLRVPSVEIQHGIFARIPASENLGLRIVQDITDSESIVNSYVTRESAGMVHEFLRGRSVRGALRGPKLELIFVTQYSRALNFNFILA